MNIKGKLKKIAFFDHLYVQWKWRERKVSWGAENPDKTFFVIRRAQCKAGLFSLVMIKFQPGNQRKTAEYINKYTNKDIFFIQLMI